MERRETATIKQWRRNLVSIRDILLEDPESDKAKKTEARRRLLIATASDDELEEMAKLTAEFFDCSLRKARKDLKHAREEHRNSVEEWRGDLGKSVIQDDRG